MLSEIEKSCCDAIVDNVSNDIIMENKQKKRKKKEGNEKGKERVLYSNNKFKHYSGLLIETESFNT